MRQADLPDQPMQWCCMMKGVSVKCMVLYSGDAGRPKGALAACKPRHLHHYVDHKHRTAYGCSHTARSAALTSSTPPTTADLKAGRKPARSCRKPPVAAPAMMALNGSSCSKRNKQWVWYKLLPPPAPYERGTGPLHEQGSWVRG